MITIYDHQIFQINRHKTENSPNSLIYKDDNGILHTIDFNECANNYAKDHPLSNKRCIGERNIEKGYFLLFTNGIQTKIIFKKCYVFDFQNHILYGSKQQRFLKLKRLISELNYTTFDLT